MHWHIFVRFRQDTDFFVVSERPKKWHSMLAFFISVDNNIHVVTETFFHFNSLRNIHVFTCIYTHNVFIVFILPHLQEFFDDIKKKTQQFISKYIYDYWQFTALHVAF